MIKYRYGCQELQKGAGVGIVCMRMNPGAFELEEIRTQKVTLYARKYYGHRLYPHLTSR
jgi:hypothetical protein